MTWENVESFTNAGGKLRNQIDKWQEWKDWYTRTAIHRVKGWPWVKPAPRTRDPMVLVKPTAVHIGVTCSTHCAPLCCGSCVLLTFGQKSSRSANCADLCSTFVSSGINGFALPSQPTTMPQQHRRLYSEDEERFLRFSRRDSPISVKEETGYELATIVQVMPSCCHHEPDFTCQ